ncbi:MAG: hypothetical protein HC828_08150 [Blastochloris sp.]|nr:hypothetical protein [Blastochloris sp.]
MAIKTGPFDATDHLRSDEAIAMFVDEAIQSSDSANLFHALGVALRAKNKNDPGKAAQTCAKLYRDMNAEDGPSFVSVVRLLRALGLRVSFEAKTRPKLVQRRPASKKMP